MPRPQRIEYPDAYYHVMNRGLGRKAIFHGNDYYMAFLQCLQEAHDRFGLQVLSYCLMSNHYHLLVKTPEGNLSRAIRHVNGVYTQRHNRYQLQLSRYIHRNPLEAKMVDKLEDYPWSSYGYYVTGKKKPSWLYQNEVYSQLNVKRHIRAHYSAYVAEGIDEDLKQLYSKTNQVPYLGSTQFREWAYGQRDSKIDDAVDQKQAILFRPSIDEIVSVVAKKMKVSKENILARGYHSEKVGLARKVAMYLCHRRGGHKLKDIAVAFNLKRYASVSTVVSQFEKRLQEDGKLYKRVKRMI